MPTRAKVAVLRTKPASVLEDYRRLLKLAGADKVLDPKATTILKDNISWHYPMPSANTTPWQLEGTILGLKDIGITDISCVQNKTVVIDTHKGEDLNQYVPIFKKCGLPVLYNTSFNLFGDPLVCTPRDAVRSFYSSGIDALFVGNFFLEK